MSESGEIRLVFEHRPERAALSDEHVRAMLVALVRFFERHQRHPTLEEEEALHAAMCSLSDWDSPLSWVAVPLPSRSTTETPDKDLVHPMCLCSSFFAYRTKSRLHLFTMQPHM